MKIWTWEHDFQRFPHWEISFPYKNQKWVNGSRNWGWVVHGPLNVRAGITMVPEHGWCNSLTSGGKTDFLLSSNERKAMWTRIKVAGRWGDNFYHSKPRSAAKLNKIINLNYDSCCYPLIMTQTRAPNGKLPKGQKSTKQRMKSSNLCWRATRGLRSNGYLHNPTPVDPSFHPHTWQQGLFHPSRRCEAYSRCSINDYDFYYSKTCSNLAIWSQAFPDC